MNKQQFLLLKLAEECAEVAQRASKQIQFGKDERQKDHAPHGAAAESKSNGERLKDEILDVYAIVSFLAGEGEISLIGVSELSEARANKKSKLQKYLDRSASLRQVPEINHK